MCCMDRADLCLSEETASISFYRAIAASLKRLRTSRLLLPRSGLERSDFVRWPQTAVEECLLFRCYQRMSRHLANKPKTMRETPSEFCNLARTE
jgi:hypothetical protein